MVINNSGPKMPDRVEVDPESWNELVVGDEGMLEQQFRVNGEMFIRTVSSNSIYAGVVPDTVTVEEGSGWRRRDELVTPEVLSQSWEAWKGIDD